MRGVSNPFLALPTNRAAKPGVHRSGNGPGSPLLSPELRTRLSRTQPRTSGQGRARTPARTTSSIQPNLLRRTHSPRATSCRTARSNNERPLRKPAPGVRLTRGLNRTRGKRRHGRYHRYFHAGTAPRAAASGADPELAAARPGQTLIGDKNYFGAGLEATVAGARITLLRPARKGEPERAGARFLKPL